METKLKENKSLESLIGKWLNIFVEEDENDFYGYWDNDLLQVNDVECLGEKVKLVDKCELANFDQIFLMPMENALELLQDGKTTWHDTDVSPNVTYTVTLNG